MGIEEYKAYTRQRKNEVGKWHHAYDCVCVTDVRISPIKQIEGLTHTKALAEIVFNDQLFVRFSAFFYGVSKKIRKIFGLLIDNSK